MFTPSMVSIRVRRAVIVAIVACGLAPACSRQPRHVDWDALVSRVHFGISCTSEVRHHTEHGAVVIDNYFGKSCDRVGLALWFTSPASHVAARLAGDDIVVQPAPAGYTDVSTPLAVSEYFVGHRRPAGFNSGDLRVGRDATLRIRATLQTGVLLESDTVVECCGGWG